MASFKEEIKEIFGYRAEEIIENPKAFTVEIRLEDGIRWPELLRLTKLLGTEDIEFGSWEERGCPTCGNGGSGIELECSNVKFGR